MKKSYRVKKESEFQKVFHTGKSYANRRFVLYFIQKKEQPHFRVGLSVGKKIGNAVTRNQVKRYIRQSLLELKPQLKADVDFIIIARKGVEKLNYFEVKQNMNHLLQLAQLLTSDKKG